MPKSRAQREAEFRAEHGVSSGTWYEMRRKGAAAGISPQTFDAIFEETGRYSTTRNVAQTARVNRHFSKRLKREVHDIDSVKRARYEAGQALGIVPSAVDFNDFDESRAFFDAPNDYDWWYH